MKIWIDLANSPHVPFFRALADEFASRGHGWEATAREFAQTAELARAADLRPEVIGGHGGRSLKGKAGNLVGRAWALRRWARGRGFALAVGHNSYSQIVAARLLGLPCVTLMDYEHQPANHLAFRLASRVVVPRAFPDAALRRFGASAARVRRYDGFKEDVYLADFRPDEAALASLRSELGADERDALVVVRPPARDALYHRFENELFDLLLERLAAAPAARVVLLARNPEQRAQLAARADALAARAGAVTTRAGTFATRAGASRFVFPARALDGRLLVAAADLVVSAGGTMNREAAALGTPAATIYAGAWAAVDEELVREGRLLRLAAPADVAALPLARRNEARPRRAAHVRAQVAELILGVIG